MRPSRNAILAALASAVLFGGTTPLTKILSGHVPPVMLAALLYLGSGIGLWTIRILRLRRFGVPHLAARDWWGFFCAIAAGGVMAPILLLSGLTRSAASSAALLLNLEAVFTALIAWLVFRESTDRRLMFGMFLIVAGGAVLAWPRPGAGLPAAQGALLIAGACAGWAIDNNLTRRISVADADFIAGTKGLIAGVTNLALAAALGAVFPAVWIVVSAMSVGLLGYGMSLVFFVLAMRNMGAARAGAYRHDALTHEHAHFPDSHHRHGH